MPIRQVGRGSPFCELILTAPVPEGFREPVMSHYTDKDDPQEHLQWFEDAMSIRQMTDAFKCRLFAISFQEKARDWFHQLPPGSIYSFEDLKRSFLLRFSTSKKRRKGAEALFLIKQRSEESLGSYVDRFQEEVLLVNEVPGHTLQLALTLGLRQGLFRMGLSRDPPLSYEELMERAGREIEVEATNPEFAAKMAKWAEGRGKEKEPQQQLGWRYPEQNNRQGPRPPLPPPQQAMGISQRRRRNRAGGREGIRAELPFCDFHQAEGHATATCPEFLEVREGRRAPAGGELLLLGDGREERGEEVKKK